MCCVLCAVCDCASLASKPFSGWLGSIEQVPRRLDSLLPWFQGSEDEYTRNSERAKKMARVQGKGEEERRGKGDGRRGENTHKTRTREATNMCVFPFSLSFIYFLLFNTGVLR